MWAPRRGARQLAIRCSGARLGGDLIGATELTGFREFASFLRQSTYGLQGMIEPEALVTGVGRVLSAGSLAWPDGSGKSADPALGGLYSPAARRPGPGKPAPGSPDPRPPRPGRSAPGSPDPRPPRP